MFERFFGNRRKKVAVTIIAHLNMRIDPDGRVQLFEDPLEAFLQAQALGTVTGGGTELGLNGEGALSCDLEIQVEDGSAATVAKIVKKLTELGAPKRSEVRVDDGRVIPFGTMEGLCLFLNRRDLPDEVYEAEDPSETFDGLVGALKGVGAFRGAGGGEDEMNFYFYGPSYEAMKDAILKYVVTDPVCELCRVERIA